MSEQALKNQRDSLVKINSGSVQSDVLKALHAPDLFSLTRAELALNTGRRISSMCSALDALQRRGLVREAGTVWDWNTKRHVLTYRLTSDGESHMEA